MADKRNGSRHLGTLTSVHSATFTSLTLVDTQQDDHDQVGIYAADTITQGQMIGTIPRSEMLSYSNSSVAEFLSGSLPTEMNEWALLILTLLYEGRQGKWVSYLETLPTSFSTPMFWTESELRELRGTSLLSKIGKEEADAMFRDQIEPILLQHPDNFLHGIEQFHRMGSLIMAFAIDLPVPSSSPRTTVYQDTIDDSDGDEEATEKFMCPLLDLLVPGINAPASSTPNTRLVLTTTEVRIYASSPLARGDRLMCPHDEVPNSELLRRFGYTIPSNSFDTVEVQGDLVTSYHYASTSSPSSSSSSVVPTPASHTARDRESATLTAREKLEKEDWCLDMEILDDSFVIPSSGKVPTEMLQVLYVMALPIATFRSLKSSLLSGHNPDASNTEDSSTVVSDNLPKPRKTAQLQCAVLGVLEYRMALYATTPHSSPLPSSVPPNHSPSASDDDMAHGQESIQAAGASTSSSLCLSLNSRNARAVQESELSILRRAKTAVQNWTIVDPSDHVKPEFALDLKSESKSESEPGCKYDSRVAVMGHSKRSASQSGGRLSSPTMNTISSQTKRARR